MLLDVFLGIEVTKNNFVQVFNRWVKEVLPSIKIPEDFYKNGLIDGDFFLADLLSYKNKTINDKLRILLKYDSYQLKLKKEQKVRIISFKDKGKAS